jgi:hypothetical protein
MLKLKRTKMKIYLSLALPFILRQLLYSMAKLIIARYRGINGRSTAQAVRVTVYAAKDLAIMS